MKTCSHCKVSKKLVEFHKNASKKDNYHDACKICRKVRTKNRYRSNKDKILAENAIWKSLNKERIKEVNGEYYQKNKSKIRKRNNEYDKLKRREDVNYKLSTILRSRLYKAISFIRPLKEIINLARLFKI